MTAACLLVRSPACSARQLQTSIVQVVHLCPTGFRKEPCERLERHKPKGLRVVLRGLGSSNAPRLPGGGGGNVTSLPDPWGSNPLGPPGAELWHLVSPSRRYLLGKVIAASFNPFDVAFTVIGPGRPERPLTITWQRPL